MTAHARIREECSISPLETFVCKTLFKEDLQSACSNSKDFPKSKSTCVLF